jgi:hypothetical protein
MGKFMQNRAAEVKTKKKGFLLAVAGIGLPRPLTVPNTEIYLNTQKSSGYG